MAWGLVLSALRMAAGSPAVRGALAAVGGSKIYDVMQDDQTRGGGRETAPFIGSFPLEPQHESYGGFQTVLKFYNWKSQSGNTSTAQQEHMGQDLQAVIFLPYPMTLQTGYTGKFEEDNNVSQSYKRGPEGAHTDALLESTGQQGAGIMDAFANPNGATQMSGASVMNNHIGMVYKGANLRSHTFNWKMTPTNAKEQDEISKIIKCIKVAATPTATGMGGKNAGAATMSEIMSNGATVLPAATQASRVAGRLGIPMTCAITFMQWDGSDLVPNNRLFSITDSFLTDVQVNYTPTGMWNAYQDGGPIETQMNITFKEITPVTQQNIMQGY